MAEVMPSGSVVAGYRIDRVAGRGGMGVVYLAEHIHLGRRVALKTLSGTHAEDPQFRERFIRESRVAAALDHHNVVPIYDAGQHDGMLYIAMRYVDGEDLDALVEREAPLEATSCLDIFHQVADALDAAHSIGLVHRDVKPGNVLLEQRRDGRTHASLADFGLTKHASSTTSLTNAGQLLGTLAYIAPEQIEGKDVDGRADQYALGCMLFECLTGRHPFQPEGDTALAVIVAHLNDPPPPITSLRTDLPAALDDVIGRALAKRPEDRYPSCGALVAAAATALRARTEAPPPSSTPVEEAPTPVASPPEPPPQAGSTSKPSASSEPAPSRPAAAAVTSSPPSPPVRWPPAASSPGASPASPAEHGGANSDPGSTAFFSAPPVVEPSGPPQRSSRTGVLIGGLLVLAVVVVGAFALLRGEPDADVALVDPPDAPPAAPEEDVQADDAVQPDPAPDEAPEEAGEGATVDDTADGALPTEELAFVSDRDGEYDIFVVEADGTGLRNLTRSPDSDDRQPAWSPDRRHVAFTSDRDGTFAVHVMAADGTDVQRLVDTTSFDPAWSPDGTGIAYAAPDGTGVQRIMVIDFDTGETRQVTDGAGNAQRPHWSPDGTMLTYHSDARGALDVFVTNADGTQPRNLTEHAGADFHPRWAPDGGRIAFGSDRDGARAVFVVDVATGEIRKMTDDPTRDDYEPTWSPDGEWIAFQSDRDQRHELHLVRSDGSGERVVVVDELNALDPQWW
jgi:serine/threonine protein kinase/Tol biopolymer transport system component